MIELEIEVTTYAEVEERTTKFMWARAMDDGAVSALEPGRRIVLRLNPPPGEKESPWRLIERVARAVAEASEFGS